MFTRSSARRAFLVLAAMGVLGTLSASWSAQLTSTGTVFGSVPNAIPASDETLHVDAGDILEVLPVIDGGAESFAWVFTKDRKFLEATREKIFRAREVVQGDYDLDVTVNTGVAETQFRRNFRVQIGTHDPTQDPLQERSILQTVPATIDDTIALPSSLQVVKLIPDRSQVSKFGITFDVERTDTGSMLPIDNTDTYAYTDATPLWIWFPAPRERVMQIALQRIDGTTETRRIRIAVRPAEDPVVTGNGILAVTQEDGSIRFSVETDRQTPNTVTYWDFGDGMQSMLEQPAHMYRHDGVYTVSAIVRDLNSGKTVFSAQTVMAVSWTNASSSSATSSSEATTSTSSSSSSTTVGSGSTVRGGFGLSLSSGTLRLIIIVLCILVMLGVLVWLLVAFLRRSGGSLESSVASAEALILKNTPSSNVTEAPPPMELRRRPAKAETDQQIVDVTPVEMEKKSEQRVETPPPAEMVDMNQAPAWLKKGLEKPEPGESKPQPVELGQPEPEHRETGQGASTAVAPTEPEPQTMADAPLPPWMQPQPTTEAAMSTATDAGAASASQTDLTIAPERTSAPTQTEEEETPARAEPVIEAPLPEPLSTPTEIPAASLPKQTDEEKDAREREKRRLKRMRYRANLKKRKTEEKSVMPTNNPEPLKTPAMTLDPITIADKDKTKELRAAALTPELAAPIEPLELTAANPATELPAPAESVSQVPATPKNDEEVKFVISADSVTPPPEGPAQPST